MTKGTTRRSLSVKGTTYARLHAAAEKTGTSISGFAEEVFGAALDRLAIRNFTKEEAEAMRPKASREARVAEALKDSPFTFPETPEPTTRTPTPPAEAFVPAPSRDDAEHVREPPSTKAPTLAPADEKKTPRGGGVHSF